MVVPFSWKANKWLQSSFQVMPPVDWGLEKDLGRSALLGIARRLCNESEHGAQYFLQPQGTHSDDAVEFSSFPPHCVDGNEEPEAATELSDLPFSHLFTVFAKDSISSAHGTELDPWLADHPEATQFIVTGDFTDLCIYQLGYTCGCGQMP